MEDKGFTIEVAEYGDIVRKYSDTNRKRFMEGVKDIINDHLENSVIAGDDNIKNIQISIYAN